MLQQHFARTMGALALTLVFVSCGGGSHSNTIPATVQSQPSIAGDRAYRWLHYVAHPLPANFVPSAIMRNGRIPGSFGKEAAIYSHGRIYQLGSFNGASTTALFVNDRGEAVGSALQTGALGPSALLFANGSILKLQPQPTGTNGPYVYNAATVISDTGAIYGTSDFQADSGFPETVRFSPNHPAVRLPTESGQAIGPISDINRYGRFAYQHSFGDAPFSPLAALGNGLSYTFLFGQRGSGATSINDLGHVAGYIDPVDEPYYTLPGYVPDWKAFVKTGSSLTILPYLQGTTIMEATGLNNGDAAVGSAGCQWYELTCPARVFVYTHSRLYDAARLLPTLFSSPVSLLPGLSDDGAFVVMKGSTYYLVSSE